MTISKACDLFGSITSPPWGGVNFLKASKQNINRSDTMNLDEYIELGLNG